jgi:hypothetical protein
MQGQCGFKSSASIQANPIGGLPFGRTTAPEFPDNERTDSDI